LLDGRTQTKHALPVDKLEELVTASVVKQGEVQGNRTNGLHRRGDPLAWKVNLFPDMPYGLFEPNGAEGTIIAVRGYEAQEKMLIHRPDYGDREKREMLFQLPRTLWITCWKQKALNYSYIFTVPGNFPSNVNDAQTILHPWGAGNVQGDGAVCWGSATPRAFGVDGVNAVAGAFYASVFNDHIPTIALTGKWAATGNPHGSFSLYNLWKMTTEGKTGDAKKVGEMKHGSRTVTLGQTLSRIGRY
jgi:hypothetical protein